jgi:hypothetical protein
MKTLALPGAQPLREFAHVAPKMQFGLTVLFVGMVVAAVWVALARRSTLDACLAFVPFAVAWLRLDQYAEGRVLISFGDSHGLTESDLLPLLVVAIVLVVRAGRLDHGDPLARGPAHRR